MSRTSVVIAHYHAQGKVARDLLQLVQALRPHVERIVFVSTGIGPLATSQLAPFADVIARENVGYDFWSYKVGLDRLGDVAQHDRIVLFNSSFITLDPNKLLAAILAPPGQPGLRGLTMSAEVMPHLQSYWISFDGRALLGSDDFRDWWGAMTPVSERWEVVHRYEIGMSRWFADRGWPLQPAVAITLEDRLVMAARAIAARAWRLELDESRPEDHILSLDLDQVALNPTHFLWDKVLQETGTVKIELARSNPKNLALHELFGLARQSPELNALLSDALA